MVDTSDTTVFNQRLLEFLRRSPTPFHAVANMVRQLRAAGFVALQEHETGVLQPGGKYYLTRNDSSLVAFVHGQQPTESGGVRMFGAHTDSPCLKLKPKPDVSRHGYRQLGVEVYGGVLLAPWFDRDLSIAGRVSYRDAAGGVGSALVDFERPMAVVPSLAIHLDREVNRQRSINPQKEMLPVITQADDFTFRDQLAQQLARQWPSLGSVQLLDHELSLYDTQPPALVGLQGEFIASARLDNLLSCFVGLEALCAADTAQSCLLICTDHEEVGSVSRCGARGPLLQQFLERVWPDSGTRARVLDRSLMISADNAHGVHPNFSDRHDDNHGPLLNAGPVIKVNANQRYASSSETSALFRLLCESVQVPVQSFVSRTDMECGSTIGPLTAAEVGVKTVDVGVPTFAMHSIRELAGSRDASYLCTVAQAFFAYQPAPGQTSRPE